VKIFAVSGSNPKSAGVDVKTDRIESWFQKPINPIQLIDALDHQYQ